MLRPRSALPECVTEHMADTQGLCWEGQWFCYKALVTAELARLGLQSGQVCQNLKQVPGGALELGGYLSLLAGLVAAGSLHRHSVRPAHL